MAQTTITKDVPVSLAINQTGINRVIASQWSSINTQWFGSYQGVGYEISLDRPVITLFENKIEIALTLQIASSVYMGEVTINPALTTPVFSTSTQEIKTEYENLRDEIDSINEFTNNALKDVLENLLDPIDWVIFKGGILDALTGRLSDTSDLEWIEDTSIDFQVAPGELLLTVTPSLVSTSPYYLFRLRWTTSNKFEIEISSNNKIKLKALRLYHGSGSTIFHDYLDLDSSYDSGNDKYVIPHSINFASTLNFITNTRLRLNIERGGNETLWYIDYGTIYKNNAWSVRDINSSGVSTPTGD
ncbi:MAG: hypothetical protein WD361_06385 [Gracilimonas sp.]